MHQLFNPPRAALSSALTVILSIIVIYSRVATASDLGREVLRRGDGWGSYGPGVTGGSAADRRHVFEVSTWQQLRDALGGTRAHQQTTPRIIYVKGTINAMERSNGKGTLTCETLAKQVTVAGTGKAFSMADFIRHFNPAGPWGRRTPAGPLEEARRAATRLQVAQIQQRFGSNVSLIGVGRNARIIGAHLLIRQVSNVIVRNLRISDAYDCFPEWDPN